MDGNGKEKWIWADETEINVDDAFISMLLLVYDAFVSLDIER